MSRARKIERFFSQPMFVAKAFTGQDGRYVKVKDTVNGFRRILRGELDEVPESYFFMKGPVDEVVEAYEKDRHAA